ncbi:MAG: DUF1844 domain-containing protein [Acidobacteria bacterium]|nr:DUF1844 domain-containing protein [Acidobacteriota bacterium]
MPDRKEEEPSEFKVVDRRLFTSEGERRRDIESEPPKVEKPAPKPPVAEAPKAQPKAQQKAAAPGGEPRPERGVGFEQLVMSLITTAMFQLGMAARPGEAPPPPDLPAAQDTIELLQILQEKTKGNLTKEEEEILSGGLYELRMVFVELTRRVAQAAKAGPKPGPFSSR